MTKEYRHLIFGLVAAVASFFIASSFDVAQAPAMTAAITVFVAWLWITEAVPIPVASLVPFVAFPTFGILTHKQAASALGSHVILLLMGAFILAKGIEKSGVHRRFALNMVKTIGNHSARRIIFAFMITAGTLSIWISNTASTLALLPVALIIAKYSENKRFAIALLLGLAYSASIGGVGSLIGTPPNVIFASVYEEFTGQEYGFLRWMKTGVPVMAIAIPLMALWLSRGIKLDREIAIPDVGVMRTEEKRTLLVFGFTALLWVFRKEPFGGWSGLLDIGTLGDSSVALFGVLLMFVVPAGKPHIQGEKHEKLLDWETAKDIPWGMLLLFAGGIVIAKASWGLGKVQAGQLDDSVISGQKVCVIDTGYSLGHEDLMSGANISGQVLDATGGQASLGEWSTDGYGHGTFISGVISAQENNLGVRGVIPGSAIDIHNVKVIHNPNYWTLWGSDMIAAVAACQQVGATVINMSIGGGNSSEAERQAMDNAAAGGALLFAAAGNRGNSSYFYPASYDGVISVAATDEQDARWNYSHQNDQVELAAPGVNVRSTLPNNSYSNWDGTSVATAFASGVAALVWGQFPECSADQVRSALTRSALDKGAQGKDDEFGHGIIQAKAAYDLLSSEGCGVQQAGIQSCKDILDAGLSTGDGIYSIDLDGEDGPLAAMNVQCDMTRDGGGWTGITPGIE